MALNDIILEVRRLIEDDPWSDTITAAPSGTTGVTMTVGTSDYWEAGDVAEFSGDGEQVLILAVSGTSVTNMVRGYNGTTAGTHTTAELLAKHPRYSRIQIEKAIARAADMLYPDVYEIKSTTITPSANSVLYNLPTDYEKFEALYQQKTGTVTDVVRVNAEEAWNLPTAVAASGRALRITPWYRTDDNATLTYHAKVSTATTDAGLQRLMAMAAAKHLLIAEAAEKSDRQEDVDRISRILRSARFLEDEFELAKKSYQAGLTPRAGARRFVR